MSAQLFVKLYTLSIYPSAHKQLEDEILPTLFLKSPVGIIIIYNNISIDIHNTYMYIIATQKTSYCKSIFLSFVLSVFYLYMFGIITVIFTIYVDKILFFLSSYIFY